MKTPKEYRDIYMMSPTIQLPELFTQCQNESYNQGVKDALKLAAEKATIEHTWCIDLHEVDKDSILNLEKELLK